MSYPWILPMFLLSLAGPAPPAERSVPFARQVMGTWATIAIVSADSTTVVDAAHAALDELTRVDALMSNWKDTSEVSRLNREAGTKPVLCDEEVASVLATALEIAGASGGAFDVTVEPLVRAWGFLDAEPRRPSVAEIDALREGIGWQRVQLDGRRVRFAHPGLRVDLGGIAKGHAVDRARAALVDAGVENALIDLSGNMIALGRPAGRDAWTVGVRDPEDRAPYFARLRLADEAIATSGNYEQFVAVDGRRYGHVLDPRTGWPTHALDSATVLAPTAREADAWATALLVLGPQDAMQIVHDRDDLAAVLVQPATDGRRVVWVSRELAERFALVEVMQRHYELRWF